MRLRLGGSEGVIVAFADLDMRYGYEVGCGNGNRQVGEKVELLMVKQ